MLSGASITGIKFDTVSSSGFTPVGVPHDVPMSSVIIALTGTNDLGQSINQTTTTDANGAYAFNNVADGHYNIQEVVPTGYTQSAGPAFYTVDVIGGLVYTGSVRTVDNFTDPTPETDYLITGGGDPNPLVLPNTGPTSDIIGGKRDLTVHVLGATNPISASGFVGTVPPVPPALTADGVFRLNSASSGPGTEVTMHYDANGAAGGLMANLAANGGNGFRFDFDFLQVGTGTTTDLQALLTSPGGGTAMVTTNITANPGPPEPFSVFVPFSSFSTSPSFTFSNVSSIQFSFNHSGVQDVDFELTQISGVDQTNSGYNFGNFPMPGCLSGFVYVDSNNNGNKDAGEPPIQGVIVTLMGTNDLGQSITQTTTTDAAGAYIFNNLRPGGYKLTETQPINFIDGKDTIGTPGGTTTNDMFSNIKLLAGVCGMNNNFGELGLTPTYASKRSLLSPAQPVNLMAVYAAAANSAATSNAVAANPAVSTAAKPATTAATNPSHPVTTSTAKTVVATPAKASARVLVASWAKPSATSAKPKR